MALAKFAQSAAEQLSAYNWRIESKFQAAALASLSPMRRVLSLEPCMA